MPSGNLISPRNPRSFGSNFVSNGVYTVEIPNNQMFAGFYLTFKNVNGDPLTETQVLSQIDRINFKTGNVTNILDCRLKSLFNVTRYHRPFNFNRGVFYHDFTQNTRTPGYAQQLLQVQETGTSSDGRPVQRTKTIIGGMDMAIPLLPSVNSSLNVVTLKMGTIPNDATAVHTIELTPNVIQMTNERANQPFGRYMEIKDYDNNASSDIYNGDLSIPGVNQNMLENDRISCIHIDKDTITKIKHTIKAAAPGAGNFAEINLYDDFDIDLQNYTLDIHGKNVQAGYTHLDYAFSGDFRDALPINALSYANWLFKFSTIPNQFVTTVETIKQK